MTSKTEADIDQVFAKLMALTPSEMAERVKQYADHPFVKTLRELNQVDGSADRIAQLEEERDEALAQLAQRQVPADGFWDVSPQVTDPKHGPEPSLREVLYRYYFDSGIEHKQAMQFTLDYIKAMLAASPTPPQREPLTDRQILDALQLTNQKPSGLVVRIVRAIERTHGIGATHD